jgi:threonine dehydratase
VNENDLEQAVLLLLKEEKAVVEGAGAAGLAALMTNREYFAGKHVGIILSRRGSCRVLYNMIRGQFAFFVILSRLDSFHASPS